MNWILVCHESLYRRRSSRTDLTCSRDLRPRVARAIVRDKQGFTIMKIYIGADHRGFSLKEKITKWLDEKGHFIHVGMNEYDKESAYINIEETDYACGCALFVRSEVLRNIGLLDEKYYLIFEEN